jgi:hypothetical protein
MEVVKSTKKTVKFTTDKRKIQFWNISYDLKQFEKCIKREDRSCSDLTVFPLRYIDTGVLQETSAEIAFVCVSDLFANLF